MSLIPGENSKFFEKNGLNSKEYLEMRGFSSDGVRSGGLRQDAKQVTIPAGAVLFRLYQRPDDFGCWWFTSAEYLRIQSYFGVSQDILLEGRDSGKSALHGVLALLSEWYWNEHRASERAQLLRLHIVRLIFPLYAMYGQGDIALSERQILKPVLLDGQKGARQIYLPQAKAYRTALALLPGSGSETDTQLHRLALLYSKKQLEFEFL